MEIWKRRCIAAPSLICFDLCNLESQVHLLEKSGTDLLHVDILDGYFSPSMPLGLDTVRQLRKKVSLPFDVHLMAREQNFFIDELLDMGVQQIIFHLETADHPDHLLNKIKNAGIRAGLALKPSTPVSQLEYLIEKCDAVLLMLINPGFASAKGEKQVPYAGRKLKDLHSLIQKSGVDTLVEVDGRISIEDIKQYGGREANVFVCGTTAIDRNDIFGSVEKLNTLCRSLEGNDLR